MRCNNGLLQIPDLVMSKGDRVVISDVGISWEGPNALTVAHTNKAATYTGHLFLEAIRRLYPGYLIIVAPLTLGARVIWPDCNDSISGILELTGLDKRTIITNHCFIFPLVSRLLIIKTVLVYGIWLVCRPVGEVTSAC